MIWHSVTEVPQELLYVAWLFLVAYVSQRVRLRL